MPTPELAPDEVLIATFASSVNYNTVWSAIFEPVPTFAFLKRLAKTHGYGSRHDLPTHVVGSDACGVVLRTGAAVSRWKPGDRVLVHPNYVALEEPAGHDDAILDPDQRVWGFECNFGGMGELCVARGDQLMPKPEHLSWEEAASMPLVNCTAYRMLVSPNGANMQQGDVVLVWGAGGGLGGFALQYVLAGGGYPVCVVSSEAKAQKCREAGAEWIINRAEEDYRFWDPETGQQNPREHLRLGKNIRELSGGRDVDIVFEHPGRDTFGASVFVTRRGRQGRHLRIDDGLHARVRQPLPVDVREDDRGLAPRQLPRGLGRQRALPRGPHAPDPQPQLPAVRGRAGLRRRARQRAPRQGRRALPGRRRRARACSTTSCARATCRRITPFSQLISCDAGERELAQHRERLRVPAR